jgi:hypothetical protein
MNTHKFEEESNDDASLVTVIPQEYNWWAKRKERIERLRQQLNMPLVQRTFATLKVSLSKYLSSVFRGGLLTQYFQLTEVRLSGYVMRLMSM